MEAEPRPDQSVNDYQSELSLISNAMVRLYKVRFGRGPTRAKSAYADDDTLVCTLRDSLTPAEKSMVRMGEHQRLRDLRMFLQYASEPEFREAVEQITGRTVEAFVSGIDTVNDVACELFYLEPVQAAVQATDEPGG
jgi:uncharacterized protein YbcI